MAFFTTAITTLKTLVCAIGAGLAAWGVINLLEGYGTDNPGANAHVRYRIKLPKTTQTTRNKPYFEQKNQRQALWKCA